jgi:hypothetical protein
MDSLAAAKWEGEAGIDSFPQREAHFGAEKANISCMTESSLIQYPEELSPSGRTA